MKALRFDSSPQQRRFPPSSLSLEAENVLKKTTVCTTSNDDEEDE